MITIEEAKRQIRLTAPDAEFDAENDLLALYINAAKKHCESYLDRPIVTDDSDLSGNDDIKVGLLMFVAHLYKNRESIQYNGDRVAEIPGASKDFWRPYRRMGL